MFFGWTKNKSSQFYFYFVLKLDSRLLKKHGFIRFNESPLIIMKNTFHFILKPLSVIKIMYLNFCPVFFFFFLVMQETANQKAKVNFKVYYGMNWEKLLMCFRYEKCCCLFAFVFNSNQLSAISVSSVVGLLNIISFGKPFPMCQHLLPFLLPSSTSSSFSSSLLLSLSLSLHCNYIHLLQFSPSVSQFSASFLFFDLHDVSLVAGKIICRC